MEYTATQPLELYDFSGGKTDYYLGEDPRKFQEADNFLILKHGSTGKLFTRPGSEIYDVTDPLLPVGNQRINGIRYFQDDLYILSSRKLYYFDTVHTILQGPTGNDLFDANADVNTMVSWDEWNKHLFIVNSAFNRPQKVYNDGVDTPQLRTAGLPRPANKPTLVSSGGTGNNYLYRIIYKYEYLAETLTFIDRGAYEEEIISNVGAPDVNPITLSVIPVLANGTDDNWDITNIVVEVYRTVNNGVTFYYAGEVTNGTTTFIDTVSDTILQTNPLMYTEGGVPESNLPPRCKAIHVMDDRAFYAHIKESNGEINSARVFQSTPGDLDSVPELNFVDVQDEIVGISSIRSSPVVFCKSLIYRLDGAYDAVGQGFIAPDKISDTAGCVSHNSIVQTVMGVFWAGQDGFYYTDGYRVSKISDSLDDTYQPLVVDQAHKNKIQGVFDSKKLRIWWTVQQTDATENDTCFILDLNWGVGPEMPFTTCSGGENFKPTFLEFIGEDLIRADSRGYVFTHKDSLYSDPTIEVGTAASAWGQSTIIYNYVSAAMNFGTSSARKFVPRIVVECKNETNLSLQISSINDDGRREDNLKEVRYRGNFTWGEPDVYWGDPSLLWGNQGLIMQQRRFPAKGLRCQYKQVRFTNATVNILSSDLIGTAVVDATAKTATLTDTTYDWPTLSVDLFISFEADGYGREYLITARTDDVLTFADPTNFVGAAAASKWVIRGKPKNEIMQLISYSIDYMIFGRSTQMFRSGATGGVSE